MPRTSGLEVNLVLNLLHFLLSDTSQPEFHTLELLKGTGKSLQGKPVLSSHRSRKRVAL